MIISLGRIGCHLNCGLKLSACVAGAGLSPLETPFSQGGICLVSLDFVMLPAQYFGCVAVVCVCLSVSGVCVPVCVCVSVIRRIITTFVWLIAFTYSLPTFSISLSHIHCHLSLSLSLSLQHTLVTIFLPSMSFQHTLWYAPRCNMDAPNAPCRVRWMQR